MWNIRHVGSTECKMFGVLDFWHVERSSCSMLRIWDVQYVGCGIL